MLVLLVGITLAACRNAKGVFSFSEVTHVEQDDFFATISARPNAFTLLYAPWSGHCKHFQPVFAQIARYYENDPRISVFAVDGTLAPKLSHLMPGFPTILFFNSTAEPIRYDGRRTFLEIRKFIELQLDQNWIAENDLDQEFSKLFTPTCGGDLYRWQVKHPQSLWMFVHPACSTSSDLDKEFVKASLIASPKSIGFAVVDCTVGCGVEFCRDQDVTKFPTLKFIPNPYTPSEDCYAETAESILEFLDQKRQSTFSHTFLNIVDRTKQSNYNHILAHFCYSQKPGYCFFDTFVDFI
eukprot:c4373_g1_i1.p1 GENE.c4373_g1_i1~~c4373_g1_i1.p1  ORF type:complete len:296 (+),score=39.91 c4373_g1_i1:21-908(+)